MPEAGNCNPLREILAEKEVHLGRHALIEHLRTIALLEIQHYAQPASTYCQPLGQRQDSVTRSRMPLPLGLGERLVVEARQYLGASALAGPCVPRAVNKHRLVVRRPGSMRARQFVWDGAQIETTEMNPRYRNF